MIIPKVLMLSLGACIFLMVLFRRLFKRRESYGVFRANALKERDREQADIDEANNHQADDSAFLAMKSALRDLVLPPGVTLDILPCGSSLDVLVTDAGGERRIRLGRSMRRAVRVWTLTADGEPEYFNDMADCFIRLRHVIALRDK